MRNLILSWALFLGRFQWISSYFILLKIKKTVIMLLELAVFTGWAVVSCLHFTKLVRCETRLFKYPTHAFDEQSFIQPEISKYDFINRTLFCTVLNESLTLKRRKNLVKREGGGPYVKTRMVQNCFNILLNNLLIEIVLRKLLCRFISCKGCSVLSQNCWGWQGALKVILSNPLLKSGHLELAAKNHVQANF